MPARLREELREAAAAEANSTSAFVRRLISRGLSRERHDREPRIVVEREQ
jgi:hypothetical protein